MVIQVQSTSNSSLSRSVFVADSKGGEIWKHAEWRKIITGYTRKGYVKTNPFNALELYLKYMMQRQLKRKMQMILLLFHPKPCLFLVSLLDLSNPCINNKKQQLFYSQERKKNQNIPIIILLLLVTKEDIFIALIWSKTSILCILIKFISIHFRFWLVARSGVAATCIAFSNVRKREIVVGLADNSLHCYHIGAFIIHITLVIS